MIEGGVKGFIENLPPIDQCLNVQKDIAYENEMEKTHICACVC